MEVLIFDDASDDDTMAVMIAWSPLMAGGGCSWFADQYSWGGAIILILWTMQLATFLFGLMAMTFQCPVLRN